MTAGLWQTAAVSMATNAELITLTLLNATALGLVVNQYDTTEILFTDKEIINKSKFGNLTHPLQNVFAIASGNVGNSKQCHFLL